MKSSLRLGWTEEKAVVLKVVIRYDTRKEALNALRTLMDEWDEEVLEASFEGVVLHSPPDEKKE